MLTKKVYDVTRSKQLALARVRYCIFTTLYIRMFRIYNREKFVDQQESVFHVVFGLKGSLLETF